MNKKFLKFFEERNLSVDGNNAYGELRGFEVSFEVKVMDPGFPVKLTMTFYADNETKQRIAQRIADLKIKYFTFAFGSNGMFLGFNDLTVIDWPSSFNWIYSVDISSVGFTRTWTL